MTEDDQVSNMSKHFLQTALEDMKNLQILHSDGQKGVSMECNYVEKQGCQNSYKTHIRYIIKLRTRTYYILLVMFIKLN
jgi:hypothetical protein